MSFSIAKVTKKLFFIAAVVSFSQATLIADEFVIIEFSKKPGIAEEALIKKIGGEIRHIYNILPAISAKVPKEALENLQNSPLVKNIEEDKSIMSINPNILNSSKKENRFLNQDISSQFRKTPRSQDSEYQNVWGVTHIKSKEAHDKNIKGKGVKIAILDTGIDYNHKDLKDNYKGGYNFIHDDNDPFDDGWNAHGTHIAGIIAASKNNTGIVGVAPEASLYAVKILDSSGFGMLSGIVAGVEWSIKNSMDILNISIAGVDSDLLESICKEAEKAGILIIAAAGNSYGERASYPASYKSVIAVTATDKSDNLGFFSPIDSVVEIAAPGVEINSTSRDNSYSTLSGTSQSTAFVSGVVALALSSGIVDVREKLQQTALDLGEKGRDDKFGYGLVDANDAVSKPSSYALGFKQGEKDSRSWKTWSIPDKYYDDCVYVKAYDEGWESFDRLNPPPTSNEGDYDEGYKQGRADSCSWKTWSTPDNYIGNMNYIKGYDDGWESCDRTGTGTGTSKTN